MCEAIENSMIERDQLKEETSELQMQISDLKNKLMNIQSGKEKASTKVELDKMC